MRARFALGIRVAVATIAAAGGAGAADYAVGRSGIVGGYAAGGVRAPQLLIYDDEPGVYVRAYWATPWQGRHYYPFTGKKPKVGRHERLSAVRPVPPPAETFYREWSTISLYPPPRQVILPEAPEQPIGPLK
jgi:hypothetical protein